MPCFRKSLDCFPRQSSKSEQPLPTGKSVDQQRWCHFAKRKRATKNRTLRYCTLYFIPNSTRWISASVCSARQSSACIYKKCTTTAAIPSYQCLQCSVKESNQAFIPIPFQHPFCSHKTLCREKFSRRATVSGGSIWSTPGGVLLEG